MKIAEFILDYLKRVFACIPATVGCLVGGLILSAGYFIYGCIFSKVSLTALEVFQVSSAFAVLHGLAGPFLAFPILALYAAPINSALKAIKKDTYRNVVVIPVTLFIIVTLCLFRGRADPLFGTGLNQYIIVFYAIICAHSYWFFIKKWGLASNANAL